MIIGRSENKYLTELTWDEAEEQITTACPTFAEIIKDINPNKDFTVFKAVYPFGAEMLKNMMFYLPDGHGDILPITDTRLPANAREKLSYINFPLGFVIKNNVEVYRATEDRIFSLGYFENQQGDELDLGVWEYFGWPTPYNVSAGARSLYMIPKISSVLSHKRLKKEFGISASVPKTFHDHWKVFKQLASSSNFPEKWGCEIIFLSKKWFDALKTNKSWSPLHGYLLQRGWNHCGYARSKTILDSAWEIFVRLLSKRGIKANSYVIDTLKHLVLIGQGDISASYPNRGNNEAGPIKTLQKIYVECYGLNEYAPTIMQPHHLGKYDQYPVYYSLNHPTLLESIPNSRKLTSNVENLRELKELLQHFLDREFVDLLNASSIPFTDIMRKLRFEFFHNEMYAYGKSIRPSSEMPLADKALIYNPVKNGSLRFADSSPFVHGCIRINFAHEDKTSR